MMPCQRQQDLVRHAFLKGSDKCSRDRWIDYQVIAKAANGFARKDKGKNGKVGK
jgi:hypothetical protein